MAKNTEQMTQVSLWLPKKTVQDIEKIRQYYSVSRWCWKAIDRQLQEEMREKIAA